MTFALLVGPACVYGVYYRKLGGQEIIARHRLINIIDGACSIGARVSNLVRSVFVSPSSQRSVCCPAADFIDQITPHSAQLMDSVHIQRNSPYDQLV